MPAEVRNGMQISRRSLLNGAAAAAAAVSMPAQLLADAGGQRIISLDYGLASTLLSLGVQPVGISDLADWNKWVVEPEMPSSVVDIGSSHEVDLEILIQLKPDIILTTPYLDQLLPRLQPIAKILRLEIFTPDMASAELLDFAGVKAPVFAGTELPPTAPGDPERRASAY